MGLVLVVMGVASCSEEPASRPKPTTMPQVADEKIETSLAAINQYMQSGEWVKAEAIARTLIARAPNEPRAHEMLGQVLIEKAGQIERAGDAGTAANLKQLAWRSYKTAVELDSKNAGLHHSAGLIAMTAGESAAALELFLKAESLDGTNAQYPLFAAQLLLQAKRLDDAEAALKQALAIAPDEPYVHASLAMVALERSAFDVALAEIAKARDAEPDNIGFRAQQAKIHRRKGEPRIALELLIGLDDASRGEEAVTFEIAAAYEAMGEWSKAAGAWAFRCQADPNAPNAYRAAAKAGELYLQAADRENASRWASIAQRLNADAAEVRELVKKLAASQND